MATFGDLFGDPIQVIHPTVYIYAVDDDGEVPIRQLSCVLTPSEGAMEIARGLPGPPGEKGEAARPYIDMGDIANQAALDALNLTESDIGRAWRNVATNAMHVWTGSGWVVHVNAFGTQGPQGPSGGLDYITVEMVSESTPPSAQLSGPPGNQSMTLRIPETPGPPGSVGPAAAISAATDYDNTTAAVTGDALVKLSNGKWGPRSSNKALGPYSLGPDQFTDVSSTFDDRRLIATLPLPVLNYATTVDISGVVRVDNQVLGANVGVEVRLGNPDTGVILGKGISQSGNGTKALTLTNWYQTGHAPTDTNIQIPANHTGSAGTLYVSAFRVSGLGNWAAPSDANNFVVRRFPA